MEDPRYPMIVIVAKDYNHTQTWNSESENIQYHIGKDAINNPERLIDNINCQVKPGL